MSGESYAIAVGRMPCRVDGAMTLHVGSSYIVLLKEEAKALARTLETLANLPIPLQTES